MERNTPPIVSIIGRSGAGKTTFLARLISELKSRRYRVAVIKHHARAGAEIDRPGKDSWQHFRAGADAVMVATPDRMAVYHRLSRELTPDELVALLPGPVDLVLTEGYKGAGKPAIEVARAALGPELVGDPAQLIALVTDLDLALAVPRFALEDASGIADLLETRFSLGPAAPAVPPPAER